ncbi:focadhesin [Contarinia nasturtii]|uniref:focadhesin n=1 Tax=Contarinia nasturtii TaxID=265458 RepID=UPI0012D41BA8|nr:focadhesin [Contarinia nasturtii]
MEDLKHSTNHNNVLQLSKALQKIAKAIEQQKKDPTKKESTIEELNFLKEQCISNNTQLSLLASQQLYGLVENGVLEPANVLTMFITMLSNANTPMKISVIGEGIINVLLLDLQIATRHLKSTESYVCPFGMKSAQHPIITLLIQKKNIDVLDLASKLNGICTHSDENIRSNSIAFLRPVFLHVLCNPLQSLNIESIWSVVLKQQKIHATTAQNLLQEIFAWFRITPERCLSLSTQLIDVIEFHLDMDDGQAAFDYQIYLIALILSMNEFGYDPRNAIATILKSIRKINETLDENVIDYMLICMAQIIHSISPFYLGNALEIIKVLIDRQIGDNVIVRNMLLDSLIVRLAINGKNLQAQVVADIERMIIQLRKNATESKICKVPSKNNISMLYFHPSIIMNFNLVQLAGIELANSQTETLKHIINVLSKNKELANEMHYLLRSILLSMDQTVSSEIWSEILNQLLTNVKANTKISCDTIYFMLYLLAKETNGHRQMELLRGLTSFTAIKENIPLILNTYRSLASSSSAVLRILSVDLHTKLWLEESRTYQFLHKVLISDDDKLSAPDKWEMNVVKANAIKEICSQKASQHGTDLVAPLSKILNSSLDNDLASSLALDAVVWLCKSHTVNIVSTWKVLQSVFESELKIRTTKSLCDFFGQVPLLKSASNEYEELFCTALKRLWKFITDTNDVEISVAACRALHNFEFSELTLQHIPTILYDSIILPKEYQIQIAASHNDPDNVPLTAADVVPFIPGECWIELLKNINQNALNEAIELVVHLIEIEMSQYRSGVYMLAEGRPEPKELQHLHARSPLRAMIKFIWQQSENKNEPTIVIKCLECVARKYSRPIPPLNWFFLIEYINQGKSFENANSDDQFKMKKYALTIAGNQIAHSGSAKTLIENYLQSFDASVKELDEIQMCLDLVSKICDGVSPRILATFIRDTLTFLHGISASSHFEENGHFEIGLKAITQTFDKKCLIPENIDIITDEICKFYHILPSDSKIYDKYSNYILKLPSENLDKLSTPVEWNDENFKKSLVVRTKATFSQKPFTTTTNTWMWINLLIDNVSDSNDSTVDRKRKDDLLVEISNLSAQRYSESTLSDWIMYFLGKVQSDLSQDNSVRIPFSLDLFMFVIVIAAGCDIFVSAPLSINNRKQWLNKFPEALYLLSKRSNWTCHMPRIFEFLYHLKTQQKYLAKEYNSIIRNTLICVKNHEYFLQKSTWNKFISLQ